MVKSGIPVPAEIPDESRGFTLCVPDSPEMMGIVMGAIKILSFRYYWQGTEEQIDEVTERFKRMYFEYQEQNACMDCETVADCIENNPETQDALASAIASSLAIQNALRDVFDPFTPGDEIPDEFTQTDLMGEDVGCDEDKAYGHIIDGIIDRGMQRVRDVLDQIELVTDNQEMLAATLEAMPILGITFKAVGVSGILDWFDNVREFLSDAWDAGDTLAKREKMACDLFCIWQLHCSLNFEQVREYFYNNATAAFPSYADGFQSLIALLEAMANPAELTGEFVVDTLLGTMYGFQSFVNTWFGVTISAVQNDLLMGEPNSGWSTVCDPCAVTWEFDAGTDADFALFTLLPFDGQTCIIDENRIKAVNGDTVGEMFAQFEITLDTNMRGISVTFVANPSSTGAFEYRLYIDDVLTETENFTSAGSYELNWSGESDGEHTYRFLTGCHGDTTMGNLLDTLLIHFEGNGTNPFE